MSENMEEIVSFRTTKDQKLQLTRKAELAGYHSVSEYARRKAFDEATDIMRYSILFTQELALFIAAYHNAQMEIMDIDPDKIEPIIQKYKAQILQGWNKKNGIE